MKKISTILSVVMVVGIASADLAVDLGNMGSSLQISKAGESGTYVDQALVQLIWSPVGTAQAEEGAALATGEFLLLDLITTSGWNGLWNSSGIGVYEDADVGGTDINTGYFFVRIFETIKTAKNDWYLQRFVKGPDLTEYDFQTPSTIYDTQLGEGGPLGGFTLDDVGAGGNQVIPEPAVAGLIGIFGAGMIMARRIFSKDA